MSDYVYFSTEQKETILVEVDTIVEEPSHGASGTELEGDEGAAKAGLADMVTKSVVQGQALLESAVRSAVRTNVECFYSAIARLDHVPTDVEITFGLKATGELGNVAISKASAEANYTVKLGWKPFVKE